MLYELPWNGYRILTAMSHHFCIIVEHVEPRLGPTFDLVLHLHLFQIEPVGIEERTFR